MHILRNIGSIILILISIISLFLPINIALRISLFLLFGISAYLITKPNSPTSSKHSYNSLLGFLFILCISLQWGAFIYQKIFPVEYRITGLGGMEPTISSGDDVLIQRPKVLDKGDIVTYYINDSYRPIFMQKEGRQFRRFCNRQVGRIIGLPTETITIKDNKIYINGRLLIEPYIKKSGFMDDMDTSIPIKHFFVMKDNRTIGVDSRHFGTIDRSQIKSKIKHIYKHDVLDFKDWMVFIAGTFVFIGLVLVPYFLYKRTAQTGDVNISV